MTLGSLLGKAFKLWLTAIIVLAVFAIPVGLLAWTLGPIAVAVGLRANGLLPKTGIRDRISQSYQSRRNARRQAVEHRFGNYFNDRKLPLDMVRNEYLNGDVKFTCAGINDLVSFRSRGLLGLGSEYSFTVDSEQTALKLQKMGRGLDDSVSVYRDRKHGRFVVTASNARAINELAKAAYPRKEVSVVKNTDTVSDILVTGCKTYEEAERKLNDGMEDATVLRSFVNISVSVDGRESVIKDGEKIADTLPSRIPAGSFIVRKTERIATSGKVQMPSDVPLDSDKAADRAVYLLADIPVHEKSVSSQDLVSEYSSASVAHSIDLEDGRAVQLRRFGELGTGSSPAKLFMLADTPESLTEIINTGFIPSGSSVYLGNIPDDGHMYVSVVADDSTISKVLSSIPVSDSAIERYKELGIPESDVRWSVLADDISFNGHTAVCLSDDVNMSRSLVGGLPLAEVSQRLSNDRLPELDAESFRRWVGDASRIKAISVQPFAADSSLRISAVVDGNAIIDEPVSLSPDEYMALNSRGFISNAEKKDLFMQMHGSLFSVYPKYGPDAPVSPVMDYVKGSPVSTVSGVLKNSMPDDKAIKKGKGVSMS